MTDKELLELAAKAAGLEPNGVYGWKYEGNDCIWNPLTDDGDALRLAVKLNIDVCQDKEITEVITAFMVGDYGKNTREEMTKTTPMLQPAALLSEPPLRLGEAWDE